MNKKLVIAFLGFGALLGSWCFLIGYEDPVFMLNRPVAEPYAAFYNKILLPWWKDNVSPVGYEEHGIIDLRTGDRIGTEVVPVYDLPGIRDLFRWVVIPASIVVWGLIGLAVSLFWMGFRRFSHMTPRGHAYYRKRLDNQP